MRLFAAASAAASGSAAKRRTAARRLRHLGPVAAGARDSTASTSLRAVALLAQHAGETLVA